MSSPIYPENLDAIFNPTSVAVVGASTRPGTLGNDLFHNILAADFQGVVYPVNPKAKSISGVAAYKTLSDIPGDVDLAVVILPSQLVMSVVDEAARKKVKSMIIISAGFKEVGPEGAQLQMQLTEKVRQAGIALIGPNCLGVINTDPKIKLNATFARKMSEAGNLAFISQSGALCTSVLDYAEERRMGFSKFVSFGNKADVDEIGLLAYLAKDPQTKVIAMYIEDVMNGRLFIETVRKIFWETGKPMLCLKSGRSPEGAKAAASHTGSLAGSDSIYDALLIQSGVQRVDTIAELFDYAACETTQPMPKGRRLAIITNAGGPGIMATDAAIRNGLKLAQFTEDTTKALKAALPAAAALRNPVDVIGDARSDRYQSAIKVVMNDPGVDMGVIILTPQSMTDIEEIATIAPEAVKGIGKPVVCAFMGARDVAKGVEILRRKGLPNYPFPEDAVRTLSAMAQLVELWEVPNRETKVFTDVDTRKARSLVQDLLGSANEKYLGQAECQEIMRCYKLPLLRNAVAKTRDEAAKIVGEMGKPVAMKIVSPDVVHKWDVGGVILKVTGAEAARKAFDQIVENVKAAVPKAKINGILIEEMARKGVEVILGAHRDPRFGPLMMFGLGGTFVEVLKDVSFRLAPMWQSSANRMIRQIRAFKVLTGVRGNPPSDLAAIEETLLRLSNMVCDLPEISELDINPLIVHAEGEGCSVADSRIMLRRPKSE